MMKDIVMLTMCAMMTALWLTSCTLPEMQLAEELCERFIVPDTSEANS